MRVFKCNNGKGFTLIELLVAVMLSGMVVTAMYSLYVSQNKSYTVQDQVAEMQQNARVAMDKIVRDLRMAGFGKPAASVNGFSDAITAGNNVNDNTDQITVVAAYDELSTLSANAPMGATTVTLQSAADAANFDTGMKKYLCLGGAPETDCYTVIGIVGDQLTVSPNLRRDYSSGYPAFLVKAVTYAVDWTDPNRPILSRDENTGVGAEALGSNIEDLQLAYQDVSGNWFDNPPAAEDIRSVRINILARTPYEDSDFDGEGTRPAIEDHAQADESDGYRRRLLNTVVRVRNMGLGS